MDKLVKRFRNQFDMLPQSYASLSDVELLSLCSFYDVLVENLAGVIGLNEELWPHAPDCYVPQIHALQAEMYRRAKMNRRFSYRAPLLVGMDRIFRFSALLLMQIDRTWLDCRIKGINELYVKRRLKGDEYTYCQLLLNSSWFGEDRDDQEGVTQRFMACKQRWEDEFDADGWAALMVYDVAQRTKLLTAYYSIYDTTSGISQKAVALLQAAMPRILDEGTAEDIINLRDAIRNTYFFQQGSTSCFETLTQKTRQKKENSIAMKCLCAINTLDQMEAHVFAGGAFHDKLAVC